MRKAKFLFLASLLALTGCGGDALSDVTAGDEVDKASFEAASSLNNILLHSNYHVEVTYNQTGLPPEAKVFYARSMDYAGKKIKVQYNRVNEPYYFDFSRSNDSASYTFDLYSPQVNRASETPYTKRTFENISLPNSFMGIEELLQVTSGYGLTMMSGLSFSDFNLSGGVYQLKKPITTSEVGVLATFDVVKLSFDKDNIKDLYYHVTSEIPTSDTETMAVAVEARLIFSQFNQVSVTLPEVVD